MPYFSIEAKRRIASLYSCSKAVKYSKPQFKVDIYTHVALELFNKFFKTPDKLHVSA